MKAAMSDEQLAEIAARAKAATAGTWHLRPGGAYGADTLLAIVDDNEIVVCTLDFSGSGSGARLADRSFIVQAHRDVPALLARIAELEAERHSTNEALSDAAEALRDANTAAGLVAEYHVPTPDGWLAVRREPNGDRWAIYTAGRVLGDRKAWTGEMWISVALATDSELWNYASADAALGEATRLAEPAPQAVRNG